MAEIGRATDWQEHSIRGFLFGTLKKRLKLNVTSEKDSKGHQAIQNCGGDFFCRRDGMSASSQKLYQQIDVLKDLPREELLVRWVKYYGTDPFKGLRQKTLI